MRLAHRCLVVRWVQGLPGFRAPAQDIAAAATIRARVPARQTTPSR
jgi:hypothetical protein